MIVLIILQLLALLVWTAALMGIVLATLVTQEETVVSVQQDTSEKDYCAVVCFTPDFLV